jgi:ubiquinone/menaquinone biosynthesis C-methylase UbiE
VEKTSSSHTKQSWEDAVCWLRAQPDKQELVHNAYYDDPLSDAAERYWRSNEWAAVRAVLQGKSGTALDIGAGRGIGSFALAKDGFAVTALEPDPSMIVGAGAIRSLFAAHNMEVEVAETLSEVLPFDDASFDVVYGRAVLHHIGDLPAATKEFYRVLKPGGLFIGLREHVLSKPEDLSVFLDIHPLHNLYGGENAYVLDVYIRAIEDSGLRMQHCFSPLENAMNYAPHSTQSMYKEIAEKFRLVPFAPSLVSAILNMPVVGPLALKLAEKFDNRPGRHYSFVAQRPL